MSATVSATFGCITYCWQIRDIKEYGEGLLLQKHQYGPVAAVGGVDLYQEILHGLHFRDNVPVRSPTAIGQGNDVTVYLGLHSTSSQLKTTRTAI